MDGSADLSIRPADDIASVASLASSERFQSTLKQVEAEVAQHGDDMPEAWAGPSEADPLYRLIVTCNELAMAVDDEIAKVHAYTQEKCAPPPCSLHCRTQQRRCASYAARHNGLLFQIAAEASRSSISHLSALKVA